MCTLRAPSSAIASSAMRKSSSSKSSCPTSCSASCWFGETSHGSASSPSRSGSPSVSSATRIPRRPSSRAASRVERLVDAARQRAGEDDGLGAAREVAELVHQHPELGLGHLRAPLVDLRLRARRRVDDERRGARLVADADEVVEDRLARQLLDDARAGAAAGEPGRDDGDVEPLERARDVDALAARERQHLARAVTLPELERRDGERAVERGVEGDGDDHGVSTVPRDGAPVRRASQRRLGERRRARRASRAATSGERATTPRPVADDERAEPLAGRDGKPATAETTTCSSAARPSGRRPDDPARRDDGDGGAAPADLDGSRTGGRGRRRATAGSSPSPKRRRAARSLSRCASLGAPSTVAVTPTPPTRAKPTCDQPASEVCPVLPPTKPRKVPTRLSVDRTHAAARELRGLRARVPTEDGLAQRTAEQDRAVPGRRDVTRLVQAVGIAVVRPPQPEPPRLRVHRRDEARECCRPPRSRASSPRRSRSGRACRSGGRAP